MRASLVLLLLVPCLLAPVYYQGIHPNRVEPAAGGGDAGGVRTLPAAAPLASPLLVTPTAAPVAPSEDVAGDAEEAKTSPGEKAKTRVVRLVDRALCVRGLETLQDLASLAYQRTSGSGYMGVIIAGALARQQAMDGETPNMGVVKKRIQAIRNGKVLRTELQQGYVLAEAACLPITVAK